MFLLYQGKLSFDSLSAVLLSLIFFHLAVNGNEVTIPSTQREKIDEAIKIVGDFLRSDKGIEWLAQLMQERKSQLTTIDLVTTILDTSSLKGQVWDAARVLKEALELKNDSIDLGFNKRGAQSNNSEENWNNAMTDVQDEDDILCLYRKNSNDPKMEKSQDWRKLLDIAPGYTIHSVTDKGSKYLICLKKINITETLTTTLPTPIITTLPNLTEETQTNKIESNDNIDTMHSRSFKQQSSLDNQNSTKNVNNQTNRRGLDRQHDENANNNFGDNSDEADCSSNEQDETNSNDTQDVGLKNVTPLYSGKSINHLPELSRRGNPLKEHSSQNNNIARNINVERSQHHKNNDKTNLNNSLKPLKAKRRHKQIRDNIFKSRKSMKVKNNSFTALEFINNERPQPKEFEFLPQDTPNFQFQMINAIQQAVPKKRMFAIPFVLYLRKLHNAEKIQLVNNMLDSFFQEKPPCNNIQQFLLPLLPFEDNNREQLPYSDVTT